MDHELRVDARVSAIKQFLTSEPGTFKQNKLMMFKSFLVAQPIEISYLNQLFDMMLIDATFSDERGDRLKLLHGVLRQKDSPYGGSMVRQAFFKILDRIPSMSFKRKLQAHPFGHGNESSSKHVDFADPSIEVIEVRPLYLNELRKNTLPETR